MGVSNLTEAEVHTEAHKISMLWIHIYAFYGSFWDNSVHIFLNGSVKREKEGELCGYMSCGFTNKPTKTPHAPWIFQLLWNQYCFLTVFFLSIHVLVLISNSLCAHSQGPRSIRLKLLCVCRMIWVLKQAAVPWRSPSLCWCHQSYTSFSFVPPHILHVRSRGRDRGVDVMRRWWWWCWGCFMRVSRVRNESGQRQVVWTQLLPSQVAGDFDMWHTNRILQLDSQSTCSSPLLGRRQGEVFEAHCARRHALCSVGCYTSWTPVSVRWLNNCGE